MERVGVCSWGMVGWWLPLTVSIITTNVIIRVKNAILTYNPHINKNNNIKDINKEKDKEKRGWDFGSHFINPEEHNMV